MQLFFPIQLSGRIRRFCNLLNRCHFDHSTVLYFVLAIVLTVPAAVANVDTADDKDNVAAEIATIVASDGEIAHIDATDDDNNVVVEDAAIATGDSSVADIGDTSVEDTYRDDAAATQDFNSLFENLEDVNLMYVDTSFAWDNKKVNAGRFDYRTLEPGSAIRIPLVDSTHDKLYVHPFAGRITSRFGLRGTQWHYGIDVKLAIGDPVKCALDGIVRAIQFDRYGYGNVVVVRHHNGLETLYGHLSKVTVKPNEPIKAGEIVGLGGNTGRSTGSHLHFETRYYGEAFNPEYLADFDDHALKSETLVLTRDNFEYLTELRKTVYYTVKKGDTLSHIAKRHGTTVNNLCRLNGITTKTVLSIGRKLVVRRGTEGEQRAASVEPAPSTSNAPNAKESASSASQTAKTVPPVSSNVYHTVKKGDTLSRIAKRYGTTVNNLCRLNGITTKTVLSIGRKLRVT